MGFFRFSSSSGFKIVQVHCWSFWVQVSFLFLSSGFSSQLYGCVSFCLLCFVSKIVLENWSQQALRYRRSRNMLFFSPSCCARREFRSAAVTWASQVSTSAFHQQNKKFHCRSSTRMVGKDDHAVDTATANVVATLLSEPKSTHARLVTCATRFFFHTRSRAVLCLWVSGGFPSPCCVWLVRVVHLRDLDCVRCATRICSQFCVGKVGRFVA